MRESRRQACIQALGLTPWVARAPLPGAAASPRLEPEAPPAMPAEREAVGPPESAPEPVAPAAPADTATGSNAPAARATESRGPRFTLHALATPSLLLMVEQADPEAPEPGRDEQALLASLLRYFQAAGARPRTFAWPLPGADNEVDQARASLEAFIGRLGSDHGLGRVLWLVDETRVWTLLGQPRYRGFQWLGLEGLAVSSLAEMLSDPGGHKRASWQAMVRHGFTG